MVKRDVIRLVEHGSRMRVVGMTGGIVNINNGCQVTEQYTEISRGPELDGRDLASTYVLCPLTIALSQFLE